MNINAYFISDVHLGARDNDEQRKHDYLLSFLEKVKENGSHLYIVGDLFDFWFEYKHVIPKHYFKVLYKLRQLVENKIHVQYLAGNHDFALGAFLEDSIGVQTSLDDHSCTVGNKRFYLFHGDGVAKNDSGYRFLKRILRHPFNQKFFKLLHPDWGVAFAKAVSGSSRKYTDQKKDDHVEQDYIEFAENHFKEGYDYVIMGHRHNPVVHKNGRHVYINLGDWIEHFTYAYFDGEHLELRFFANQT